MGCFMAGLLCPLTGMIACNYQEVIHPCVTEHLSGLLDVPTGEVQVSHTYGVVSCSPPDLSKVWSGVLPGC